LLKYRDFGLDKHIFHIKLKRLSLSYFSENDLGLDGVKKVKTYENSCLNLRSERLSTEFTEL